MQKSPQHFRIPAIHILSQSTRGPKITFLPKCDIGLQHATSVWPGTQCSLYPRYGLLVLEALSGGLHLFLLQLSRDVPGSLHVKHQVLGLLDTDLVDNDLL